MKDYNVLLTCGETTMVIIHDAFDKGYQQGYEDGQESLVNAYAIGKGEDTLEDIKEAEYNRGLNDAWTVVRKIIEPVDDGGYSFDTLRKIFDESAIRFIFKHNTGVEAIAKIKEYEDKQKQDDWRDIPSNEMTLEQARRAVKELRTEVLAEMRVQKMTNEEAIKELQSMCDHLHAHGICDKDSKMLTACKMAISALEQQSCDDAVSRADFEAHLFENYCVPVSKTGKPNQYSSGCFYKDVVKCLDELPSVTQKYGKWIEHPEIETSAPEYLMFYECSECGDKQCFCKSDIHKKRFCNNCGAKMVEPQESEDKE